MRQYSKQQDIYVINKMIELYCHGNKHSKKGLCSECSSLLDYAGKRLMNCTSEAKCCKICKTHCYKPEMREKIRIVMRYSGPRLILYHPIIAIKHAWNTLKYKRKI